MACGAQQQVQACPSAGCMTRGLPTVVCCSGLLDHQLWPDQDSEPDRSRDSDAPGSKWAVQADAPIACSMTFGRRSPVTEHDHPGCRSAAVAIVLASRAHRLSADQVTEQGVW